MVNKTEHVQTDKPRDDNTSFAPENSERSTKIYEYRCTFLGNLEEEMQACAKTFTKS